MTLRAEIHHAVDEVAPPVPELRSVVFAKLGVAKNPTGRWRTSASPNLFSGFRHAGLVAAALIAILVLVGVLVGGRVLRDWQTYSAHQHDIQVFQQQLSELRSRPVTLPALGLTQQCPSTPVVTQFDFGTGPVYANGGSTGRYNWGDFTTVTWYTAPNLRGPVLVRAGDLSHGTPIVFIGPFATGPVVGTDTIDGGLQQLHTELVLDAGHPPDKTPDGYGMWRVTQGIQHNGGCFGFQIDGPGFTENIIGGHPPA